MARAKIVLLAVLLFLSLSFSALAEPGTLQIEIVKAEHERVKDPQINNTTFLAETNLTIKVTEGNSPIPNAYVRLVYEYEGKEEKQYYKTNVWGEVTIKLPFLEFEEVEARIDAVVHPEDDSLDGSMHGSINITIVPYLWHF
jgi:hypothetical protein